MGAGGATTLRRVVLPLIRPAVFTALVYSFVTAMTAVSAVIFLVSARHNMATAYIMGRVEAGEYALAIAYSAVLMIVMIVCVVVIQLLVGTPQAGAAGRNCRAGAGGGAGGMRGSGMTETAIEFVDVVKRYGSAMAVDRISFSIAKGELVTFLGPSGCGKTTSLRLIAGLELPTEGQVHDRRAATSAATRRRSATSAWCSSPTRCFRT